LCIVSLLATAGLPTASCAATDEEARQPNFLFLLADDLGWGDLGCYGHPYIQTPNIDRLAAEGTRFERFYVSGSVCHPSRATFMTGQFLANCFGNVHTLDDGRRVNVSMAPGSVPVTRLLQKAGYKTAHVGKWHLNSDASQDPVKYGLDVFHSGQEKPLGDFSADMKERNGQDQKLAHAAIHFMKQHCDQPFYLQLWFTVPHSPVRPSAEELEVYRDLKPSLDDFEGFTRQHFATRTNFEDQMRAWCAQITGHDQVVGEVLAALEQLGLSENTIVFYSSDNGPAPPARTPDTYNEEINAMGSAGPFRARKFTYYEGGIRVPAIVRWPGQVPSGRVNKESVWAAVDWLPTVCSLAGASISDYQPDGCDISKIWFGEARPCDRELVWGLMPDRMALRDGDWKLDEFRESVSLFHLSDDPCERENVAEKHPDVAERLRKRLAEYREELVAASERGHAAAMRVGPAVGKTQNENSSNRRRSRDKKR
jgi:N-acetylgalactosamine-6-sulfatase